MDATGSLPGASTLIAVAYLVASATSAVSGAPIGDDCMDTAAFAAGLLSQLNRGVLNRMKWMRSARTIKKTDITIKVLRGSNNNHILHTVSSSYSEA